MGVSTAGLCFASPLVRQLFRPARRLQAARELLRVCKARCPQLLNAGLIIVEGITDFASTVAISSDADSDAPAVLGVLNGSFNSDLAETIPSGVSVSIATDHDAAGDRYAAAIAAHLAGRAASIVRWAPGVANTQRGDHKCR